MTTFKDRLEGILDSLGCPHKSPAVIEAKQAIIDLFLEIVGDDEPEYIKVNDGYAQPDMEASDYYLLCGRNQLRAELRNKLKGDN